VTYYLFSTGYCSGPVSSSTVTLSSGSVPNSNSTGPLAAGSYSYQAFYSGDGNYGPATGSCESFTVSPGSSSVGTTVYDTSTGTPWTNRETAGASAYDTAIVYGASGVTPTGTVTYYLYANAGCSGTPASTQTVGFSYYYYYYYYNGYVSQSNATGPLANGAYSYRATYSGDGNYYASSGACEPFYVGYSGATATALSTSVNPAVTGELVTYTATVNPAPGGGTVTFTDEGAAIPGCSAVPVATSGATARCSVKNSVSGSHAIRASFNGYGAYLSSLSPSLTEVIKTPAAATATATKLRSSLNPSVSGRSVTYTATVSPVPDGGTLQFRQSGHAIGGCRAVSINTTTGRAVCTKVYRSSGRRQIQAVYSGDARFVGSQSSALTHTVIPDARLDGRVSVHGSTVKIPVYCERHSGGCQINAALSASAGRAEHTIASRSISLRAGRSRTFVLTPGAYELQNINRLGRLPVVLKVKLTANAQHSTIATLRLSLTAP
jgi:hypothetical protein